LFLLQGAEWLANITALRFGYPECLETRSWQDVARELLDGALVTTGSLDRIYGQQYEAWACWQQHPCLSRISHSPHDAMCYVYDEIRYKWLPWGLQSELRQCNSEK
jgi:hypothetical protein